ncbi:MAG: hypothetical protein MR503_09475 [Oscillospiraceae bacterium]|nr:hypothetical protein [Oscillospiraceae bacterium]
MENQNVNLTEVQKQSINPATIIAVVPIAVIIVCITIARNSYSFAERDTDYF